MIIEKRSENPAQPFSIPEPQMGTDETQIKTSVKICVRLWLNPGHSLRLSDCREVNNFSLTGNTAGV